MPASSPAVSSREEDLHSMLTIACMRHTVQACEVTRQHALGDTVETISGVTFSNDKQGHDPALHTSDTGSHARDETCPCYGIRKNNKYRSLRSADRFGTARMIVIRDQARPWFSWPASGGSDNMANILRDNDVSRINYEKRYARDFVG